MGASRSPCTCDAGAFQPLIVLVGILLVVVPTVLWSVSFQVDGGNPQVGYEKMDTALEDLLRAGDEWCCPEDPSAASHLQDLAFRAWAGDPVPLEENFGAFFPAPEATGFTISATWGPERGLTQHEIPLYQPYDADGMRAGAQYWSKTPERGPAFVIPRLENLSGAATGDVHVIPLGREDAARYDAGSNYEPKDWLETRVSYTRSVATGGTQDTGEDVPPGSEVQGLTNDGDPSSGPEGKDLDAELALNRSKHTPVVQALGPGVSVIFEEPDWVSLASQLPSIPDLRSVERDRQLVVTEDQLLAERAIQDAEEAEQGDLLPGEDEQDNPYPHHSFQVAARLTGPGWVNATKAEEACAKDGTNATVTGAYRLAVTVPRDWTEVGEFKGDGLFNELANWSEVLITPLADGATELSSLLTLDLEVHCPTSSDAMKPGIARWVVPGNTTEIHRFRFHARPPAYANSTDLGFQEVQARLDDLGRRAYGTGQLVFELANNPGRVHRTVEVVMPRMVPVTPAADSGHRQGAMTPMGVLLLNGGEEASLERIELTGPAGLFVAETGDHPVVEQVYPPGELPEATLSGDGGNLTVTLHPPVTCPPLVACGVLMMVRVDGATLAPGPLAPPGHLTVLYEDGDVQPYVDWYIRNDHGHKAVPANLGGPGFAMAHHVTGLQPGEHPGAYLVKVAPSTDALCDEADLKARDRAPWSKAHDGFVYDAGPRETGYPWFGDDPPPKGPECVDLEDPDPDAPSSWTFPVVAHVGDTSQGRWGVDAVGQGSYRYVEGLPEELTVAWSNGVAESELVAPGQATPGQEITLTVGIESLMDQLVAHHVSRADIRLHLLDPYNAWEDLAWYTLRLNISTSLSAGTQDGEVPGEPLPIVEVSEGCETDPGKGGSECNVPPAERYKVRLRLPQDMVLGTHLAIAEVAWKIDDQVYAGFGATPPDEELWQTAHLIHPVDILTPHGGRGTLKLVGGTAWLYDWG